MAVIPPISVLVLNYGSPPDALKGCIASVEASDCQQLLEVVLVDNGSIEHPEAPDAVAAEFERTRAVHLGRNYGFAAGINKGLAECRGEWVFILNSDAELDRTALSACAASLEQQDDDCLGVVPKLLFFHERNLIDAIGNAVDKGGNAFNVGIGQLDIGQYDRVERTFGACFAAGLFRKSAFDDDHVGPLDESYFMYYEDVDWNWRANLFGYHFVTAPEGRVFHVHSAATRKLPYDFKHRLIHRNLLTTVLKNCEGKRAVKIWIKRLLWHAQNVGKRQHVGATFRLVFEALRQLPDTWSKRQAIRARRTRSDDEVFRFGFGEDTFFDPANYAPQYTIQNLVAMYRRKAVVTGEKHYEDIVALAMDIGKSRLRYEPGFFSGRIIPLLDGEPAHIIDFVKRVESEQF